MSKCLLSKEEKTYITSLNFPFSVPVDLADMDQAALLNMAKILFNDSCLDFIDDEPTDQCILGENILIKIQDYLLPNLFDLIQ